VISLIFRDKIKCLSNYFGRKPSEISKIDSVVSDVLNDSASIGEGSKVFTVVDQMPEYNGGLNAMMLHVQKNMRYPASARRMGIDGTVYVSFVIDSNGALHNIKVIRGISGDCDQEARRVVALMPPWLPGKQNGIPVTVRFVLPIKFKIGK
jgi:protein TonB